WLTTGALQPFVNIRKRGIQVAPPEHTSRIQTSRSWHAPTASTAKQYARPKSLRPRLSVHSRTPRGALFTYSPTLQPAHQHLTNTRTAKGERYIMTEQQDQQFLSDWAEHSQFGAVPGTFGVDRQAGTAVDGEQRRWFEHLLKQHGFT